MPSRRAGSDDPQATPPASSAEFLYQPVLRALQGWRQGHNDSPSPLAHLRLYQQTQRQLDASGDPRSLTLRVLEEGLRRLAAEDAEAADLLRRRFQEDVPRQQLARERHCHVSHLDRLQRMSIEKLAAAIDRAEQETQSSLLATRTLRFAAEGEGMQVEDGGPCPQYEIVKCRWH